MYISQCSTVVCGCCKGDTASLRQIATLGCHSSVTPDQWIKRLVCMNRSATFHLVWQISHNSAGERLSDSMVNVHLAYFLISIQAISRTPLILQKKIKPFYAHNGLKLTYSMECWFPEVSQYFLGFINFPGEWIQKRSRQLPFFKVHPSQGHLTISRCPRLYTNELKFGGLHVLIKIAAGETGFQFSILWPWNLTFKP